MTRIHPSQNKTIKQISRFARIKRNSNGKHIVIPLDERKLFHVFHLTCLVAFNSLLSLYAMCVCVCVCIVLIKLLKLPKFYFKYQSIVRSSYMSVCLCVQHCCNCSACICFFGLFSSHHPWQYNWTALKYTKSDGKKHMLKQAPHNWKQIMVFFALCFCADVLFVSWPCPKSFASPEI